MARKRNYLTSSALVEAVKRTAMIPIHQNAFSEDDILDFASEEMTLQIVPAIMKYHQDYFLTTRDVPITLGKTRYPIPDNAVGDKLRDVSYVDSSGNVREMTRISVDDLSYYNYGINVYPFAFYIEGNEIVLAPTRQSYSDGTLRISYYYRTAPLVKDLESSEIISIDRVSGVISVDSIPKEFTTSMKYNFICSKSPFKTIGEKFTATFNTNLKTITVPVDLIPESLAEGDFITYEGCSNIPQIPSDLHTYLMYRTAARVIEAMGDSESLKNVYAKIQQLEASTTILIESRVDAAPEKIVNNSNSLRSRSYIRKRWRY